jgi:hypothetical protein
MKLLNYIPIGIVFWFPVFMRLVYYWTENNDPSRLLIKKELKRNNGNEKGLRNERISIATRLKI